MEVMEEGNLMDRVPILLQRDMQYYQEHQSVLQENLCPGVVGGKLDFPRSASFAAIKIVYWWEDEYYAAYKINSGLLHLDEMDDEFTGCPPFENGTNNLRAKAEKNSKIIVKASDPERFVSSVTKSADKFLEHLHTLSQEALDHADLTVLTATIGAAALIKNCLWIYLQTANKIICPPKGDESGGSLKLSYKQYAEMTEALAERLFDLHVRLLSLYIIQDADCLHWESQQTFFESERGSYTIQMWWLYLQGTKRNLWNSVPPSMAQRVLAGMLNETLTILTVRYTQTLPSHARTPLLLVDVSNLLLCVTEILPSICESGEALIGLNIECQNKIIRDIHAKCQELFTCLLMRGISLGALYKILQKGTALKLFTTTKTSIHPWIIFTMPNFFSTTDTNSQYFDSNTAISLELKILLNSPQPNWALLLKLLRMHNAQLPSIIINHLVKNLPTTDCFVDSLSQPIMNRQKLNEEKCNGFMCSNECKHIEDWTKCFLDPVGQTNYQLVLAVSYVLFINGTKSDINVALVTALDKSSHKDWSSCLDKREVWNLKRPPWYEAILHLIYPVLDSIVHILISAVQTGATTYQAMSLTISCVIEMLECFPNGLFKVAASLSDIIPSEVRPLGDSVIIQLLFSGLYTKLIAESRSNQRPITSTNQSDNMEEQTICITLAEALCSIDEDNKHTDLLTDLIHHTNQLHDVSIEHETALLNDSKGNESEDDSVDLISEVMATNVLSTEIGKQSLKLLYSYLRRNTEWLLHQLGVSLIEASDLKILPGQNLTEENTDLLMLMFHIGHNTFDQLLTGGLKINYSHWLQMPTGLTKERAWLQISQRWEFQETVKLSVMETVMVAYITAQCKP